MKQILSYHFYNLFFFRTFYLFIAILEKDLVYVYHLMNVIACSLRNQITFQALIFISEMLSKSCRLHTTYAISNK